MQSQTKVLEEQLGAQVWPYVGVTESVNGDTITIGVSNDGLGPHLVARTPRGEKIALGIDSSAPGSVVRPGDRGVGFSLASKHFARPFLEAQKRLNFRICYCAILPGKCWQRDSSADEDPKPVAFCPLDPKDLLHEPAVGELMSRSF